MANATATELVNPTRSHWIALDWNAGELDISKEELWPNVRATWRGQELTAELEASRYRHSEGMSEWRVFVRGARNPEGYGLELSDVARSKLNDACVPLVREWLESDEYPAARARTFAHTLAREVRDAGTREDYRAALAIEKFAGELVPEDHENLTRALELRLESYRILDRTPAGVPQEV